MCFNLLIELCVLLTQAGLLHKAGLKASTCMVAPLKHHDVKSKYEKISFQRGDMKYASSALPRSPEFYDKWQ